MARFLIVRLVLIVVTLLAVSLAIFSLIEFAPGDAATVILGQAATPENTKALRERMGLDKPPYERYLNWVTGALRGDLGIAASGKEISGIVPGRLFNSALLAVGAFLIAVPLGLGMGVLVGVKSDTLIDRFLTLGGLVTISLPEFVTGIVLVLVLSSTLGWLPSSSIMLPGETIIGNPQVLVMPILTVTGALFAYILRMARANVIEVMESNYVRTAILKGLPSAYRGHSGMSCPTPCYPPSPSSLTMSAGSSAALSSLRTYSHTRVWAACSFRQSTPATSACYNPPLW